MAALRAHAGADAAPCIAMKRMRAEETDPFSGIETLTEATLLRSEALCQGRSRRSGRYPVDAFVRLSIDEKQVWRRRHCGRKCSQSSIWHATLGSDSERKRWRTGMMERARESP